MLAPVIPLMYLDSVVDGMLKGLNEQLSYLSYNIIDSVMRVGLILFLLPLMGLNGLIVVIFASEIFKFHSQHRPADEGYTAENAVFYLDFKTRFSRRLSRPAFDGALLYFEQAPS